MKQIADVTFTAGTFPEGWIEEERNASFEGGLLHSGRLTRLRFVIPGRGWRKLLVEITLTGSAGSGIDCGDGRTVVQLNLGTGRHRVTAHEGGTLAMNLRPVAREDSPCTVAFEIDHGRWRAFVDQAKAISYQEPAGNAFAGLLMLNFWSDCVVHRIRMLADEEFDAPLHPYPTRKTKDFFLEVTVDFPDDLYYAPFTQEMFDQLFAEYKRWGVRRCHWIYDGGTKYNSWRYFPTPRYENFIKTTENLGGEIFDAVVKAAHAHGIELYGMVKPFEMGYMLHTYGTGTPEAKQYGRFPRIGGVVYRSTDFVAEHRELMMARKPGAFGPAENQSFTRIDLVCDDTRPASFRAGEVRIFVSDDNVTYRSYEGPVACEELVEHSTRVMRFKNFEIHSPFLALVAPGIGGAFGNRLGDLVRVFGEKGEERRITLGIVPRARQLSYDIKTATSSDSQGLDFCRYGIEFDNVAGTPSACLTGYDAMREWHAFDGGHGFIGIARGKDREAVAALSPSFPETRAWWLGWVKDVLDAGADGVEMRVRNHLTHMAWGEFGFEQPVRDAFLTRHGVDIWATDDFDRAAWRRLRGEAYTEFYREARRLVVARGKRMGLHISTTMDIEPEQGAAMEMHFDWRTWLDEGLADSVTMKEVWPRSRFAEEILSHTRPRQIPVVFSPYANALWKKPGGSRVCADRIRFARENGCDGFQLYESCAVMRAFPDGRLELEQPKLRDIFREAFKI